EEAALHDLGREADRSFRGFGSLRKLLRGEYAAEETAGDEMQLLEEVRQRRTATGAKLSRFRGLWLASFFRGVRFWFASLLIVGCAVALPPALRYFGAGPITWQQSLAGGAVAL